MSVTSCASPSLRCATADKKRSPEPNTYAPCACRACRFIASSPAVSRVPALRSVSLSACRAHARLRRMVHALRLLRYAPRPAGAAVRSWRRRLLSAGAHCVVSSPPRRCHHTAADAPSRSRCRGAVSARQRRPRAAGAGGIHGRGDRPLRGHKFRSFPLCWLRHRVPANVPKRREQGTACA